MRVAAVSVVVRALLLDYEHRLAELDGCVEIFRPQFAEARPLPENAGWSRRCGDAVRPSSCACLTHILPVF